MFSRSKERTEPAKVEAPAPAVAKKTVAMIGANIRFTGEISGDEDLVIEGKIDGAVRFPRNDVLIKSSAEVMGDIDGKSVRVEGLVTKDIRGTESVLIAKSGRMLGNIAAPRVMLEDGATFKGTIDMDPR